MFCFLCYAIYITQLPITSNTVEEYIFKRKLEPRNKQQAPLCSDKHCITAATPKSDLCRWHTTKENTRTPVASVSAAAAAVAVADGDDADDDKVDVDMGALLSILDKTIAHRPPVKQCQQEAVPASHPTPALYNHAVQLPAASNDEQTNAATRSTPRQRSQNANFRGVDRQMSSLDNQCMINKQEYNSDFGEI